MKKFFVVLSLVSALVAVCPVNSFAWDDAGHKISAYIAWNRMVPQARAKAFEILMAAPEDADLSVFYLQDSRSDAVKQQELFMIASTWADIVRDQKFANRYAKYHKGNWHYSDTFWKEENGAVKILPDPEDGGKLVEKLAEFEMVIGDPNKPNAEKAIALAWILHLVGDLHQPLHTSARVTETEPKGDQGANLFSLTPPETPREKRVNLHWFWDSIVGRNIARENDECDSEYVPPLAARFTKKYPYEKVRTGLADGKFTDWQKESFGIATSRLFPKTLQRNQMPSNDYRKMAFGIAEQRLAFAGYRIAELLNRVLGR